MLRLLPMLPPLILSPPTPVWQYAGGQVTLPGSTYKRPPSLGDGQCCHLPCPSIVSKVVIGAAKCRVMHVMFHRKNKHPVPKAGF
jgi:hypothetical protein